MATVFPCIPAPSSNIHSCSPQFLYSSLLLNYFSQAEFSAPEHLCNCQLFGPHQRAKIPGTPSSPLLLPWHQSFPIQLLLHHGCHRTPSSWCQVLLHLLRLSLSSLDPLLQQHSHVLLSQQLSKAKETRGPNSKSQILALKVKKAIESLISELALNWRMYSTGVTPGEEKTVGEKCVFYVRQRK